MTHVYAFEDLRGQPLAEVRKIIGSKAANLAAMANELGLPVPPGFAVSTAACLEYLAHGWPEGLEDEIRAHMAGVERALGRRFGDPADPLLVSVRSGAPVSMPGMMDTLLNLGLNSATAPGLARLSGDASFVDACRARLAKSYPDIVGGPVPEDPWEQLHGAVEAVFRSWNSERARAYRQREGIPDDLGTGVIVQAMVFGNCSDDSATGVLFTRNPATGENVLYGDIMFRAQGEDVVAGTHQTEPIAVLDRRLPAVAAELRHNAEALERHYADVCDIEFTIERGKLWMLQTRIGKRSPQAAVRIAVEMAEDPGFPLSRAEAVKRVAHLLADPPRAAAERRAGAAAITQGLGASPGLACGEIVTTPEAAVAAADRGRRVILVRHETSPDDVHGMAKAVGLLTTTGGLASHAAVVARGWGIPAVVGAAAVSVGGRSGDHRRPPLRSRRHPDRGRRHRRGVCRRRSRDRHHRARGRHPAGLGPGPRHRDPRSREPPPEPPVPKRRPPAARPPWRRRSGRSPSRASPRRPVSPPCCAPPRRRWLRPWSRPSPPAWSRAPGACSR